MKLLISDYYNTRDDKWIYEILAIVASFESGRVSKWRN